MTPLDTLCLSKIVADKAAKVARDAIGPGAYPVDLTIRIAGTVQVGEDTTYTPTAELSPLLLLAVIARKAGCVGPHATAYAMEIAREAIALGVSGAEVEPELAAAVEAARKECAAALPPKARKGAVKVAVSVEMADAALAVAAK